MDPDNAAEFNVRPLGMSDRTWRAIRQAEEEEELARIREEVRLFQTVQPPRGSCYFEN